MAANLGQAFMGNSGIPSQMLPSLAQELAAGNFETRESFHDYIYSKLILGEDKGSMSNLGQTTASDPPVFPNTNLANSYPNMNMLTATTAGPIAATTAVTVAENVYAQSTNVVEYSSPSLSAQIAPKPISSKKKAVQQHHQQQPQQIPIPTLPPPQQQSILNTPNAGQVTQAQNADGMITKLKKKSHHKKKEKTNICDVCGRGFAEKYTLNRHMLTHTNIKPYSCTKCNMAFSRSDGLAKHMAAGHRRIDAHHCDVCGGTFNSEVSFEQHRREYGSTLPFVCNLCMLAFSQCCHLNYHMKSHSLNKLNDSAIIEDDKNNTIDVSELIPDDFTLPKSNRSSDKDTLNLAGIFNFKRNADGSMPMFNPNITIKPEIDDSMPSCGTGEADSASQKNVSGMTPFDAFNNLSDTSSTHPGSANNPISLAAGQTGSTNLNSSEGNNSGNLTEMDLKKFFDIKVPVPNARFLDGSVTPGTGGVGEDGLYHCEICGKGFTRKYHMQRHVKLHTRGPVPRAHLLDWTRRPYACGVCKMGFTRQHHLTRHMLIHTGERPHACHVCQKAFRRFTNLSLHVRTVHGAERPFKCPVCGRGFPRLYSLQRHIKLHTKELEARAKGLNAEDFAELKAKMISAGAFTDLKSAQSYSGFKAVGTIDHNTINKSPAVASIKSSPAQNRESLSSDNSEMAESYEQSLSVPHGDQNTLEMGRAEVMRGDVNNSIQNNENDYHQQGVLNTHTIDEQNSHLQNAHLQQQQQRNLLPSQTGIEVVNQHSHILSHSTDSRHSHSQVRAVADYTVQSGSQPTTLDQRYITQSRPTQSPGVRGMELPTRRGNFSELDLQEVHEYTVSQQQQQQQQQQHHGSDERYTIHPSRIQSPHSLLSNIDRPSSRGIINQPSPHPQENLKFNLHGTNSFPQQLVGERNTMSPAIISRDTSNFTLNQRGVLQAAGREEMNVHVSGTDGLHIQTVSRESLNNQTSVTEAMNINTSSREALNMLAGGREGLSLQARAREYLNIQQASPREVLNLQSVREVLNLQSARDALHLQSGREVINLQSGRDVLNLQSGRESLQLHTNNREILQNNGRQSVNLNDDSREILQNNGRQSVTLHDVNRDIIQNSGRQSVNIHDGSRKIIQNSGRQSVNLYDNSREILQNSGRQSTNLHDGSREILHLPTGGRELLTQQRSGRESVTLQNSGREILNLPTNGRENLSLQTGVREMLAYQANGREQTREILNLPTSGRESLALQTSGRELLALQAHGREILSQQTGGREILSQQTGGREILSLQTGGREILSQQTGGREILSQQTGREILSQQTGGREILSQQTGGREIISQQTGGREILSLPTGGRESLQTVIGSREGLNLQTTGREILNLPTNHIQVSRESLNVSNREILSLPTGGRDLNIQALSRESLALQAGGRDNLNIESATRQQMNHQAGARDNLNVQIPQRHTGSLNHHSGVREVADLQTGSRDSLNNQTTQREVLNLHSFDRDSLEVLNHVLQTAGRGALNLDLGNGRGPMNIELSESSRAALERILNAELQSNAPQTSLSEPPGYTLPHTASNLPYTQANTTIFQSAVNETLSRMELHPSQSVSPMPMNPQHSNSNNSNHNNLQY